MDLYCNYETSVINILSRLDAQIRERQRVHSSPELLNSTASRCFMHAARLAGYIHGDHQRTVDQQAANKLWLELKSKQTREAFKVQRANILNGFLVRALLNYLDKSIA